MNAVVCDSRMLESAPALEEITSYSVTKEKTAKKLYRLRAHLRSITPSRRDARCGVVPRRRDEPVYLNVRGDGESARASWAGVQMCNHIWSCPVCASIKLLERRLELTQSLLGARSEWRMLTVTVRHNMDDSLGDLLSGLYRALQRFRADGGVARAWRTHVTASIRTVEITWGAHGWHPHIHYLICGDPLELARLTEYWGDRWAYYVRSELGTEHEPLPGQGLFWSDKILDTASDAPNVAEKAAEYVTAAGLEIVGAKKRAKPGHWNAWQIAQNAAKDPAGWGRLWREYVQATSHHRMIEENRGAREARKLFQNSVIFDESCECTSTERRISIAVMPDDLAAIRALETCDANALWTLTDTVRTAADPQTAYETAITAILARLAGQCRLDRDADAGRHRAPS